MLAQGLEQNYRHSNIRLKIYDNVFRGEHVLDDDYSKAITIVNILPSELPKVRLVLLLLVDFKLDFGNLIDLFFLALFIDFAFLLEFGWLNSDLESRSDLSTIQIV